VHTPQPRQWYLLFPRLVTVTDSRLNTRQCSRCMEEWQPLNECGWFGCLCMFANWGQLFLAMLLCTSTLLPTKKNKEEKNTNTKSLTFYNTTSFSRTNLQSYQFFLFFPRFFLPDFWLWFLSNRILWLLSITGQVCHGIPRPNQRCKSLSYVVFHLSNKPSLTVAPFTLNPTVPIRLFQSLNFVHTHPLLICQTYPPNGKLKTKAIDDPHKLVKVIASDGKTGETRELTYTNCKVVGNGSFGVVFQARLVAVPKDQEDIAIKKVLQDKRFKVSSDDRCHCCGPLFMFRLLMFFSLSLPKFVPFFFLESGTANHETRLAPKCSRPPRLLLLKR